MKKLVIILFIIISTIFTCSCDFKNSKNNIPSFSKEEIINNYKKYDSSYDSTTFNIRKINGLKNRDDFIFGADISLFKAIIESGASYYNSYGKKESICKILSDSGINTVRIRLFHNYKSPTGVLCGRLDLDNVIFMIEEAKKYNLKVLLDLHYSDTWSDPGHQIVPYEWKDYNYNQVLEAFYNYTKDVLTTIKNKRLDVDYIQIGNEIDYGIVKPFGDINWDKKEESFDKLVEILSKGTKASREIFPNAKIIIHTANGLYRWVYENDWGNAEMHYYEELEKRKLDYDIIGASFYTFEDDKTPISYISDLIDNYNDNINKPVMIVETSYAYTYEWNDYTSNTFYTDKELAEYPVSFQGQTNLILDMIEELVEAKNNNGIGLCYWGGEFIPNTDPDMRTSWANQALFTYEGIATPTLSLFKECLPQ